jgi:signal transduction histidine kinase/AraC-like DNA-binding protein
MSDDCNDDVAELRHDALAATLVWVAGAWLASFVGSLIHREMGGGWIPAPLFVALIAITVADQLRRRRAIHAAAWALIAGLIAGPALLIWLSGPRESFFFLFLIPIIVASILMAGTAELRVATLVIPLIVGLATALQPQLTLSSINDIVAITWLPIFMCFCVAGLLSSNARNITALAEWAMDSQRKDARRAELFRRQHEQLRHALSRLEDANFQLRLLNAQLSEARRVAEIANQLKTRFLANVSHELRTPLHIILGVSEAAQSPPVAQSHSPSPALRRDLQRIQQSATHLNRLINDLLDLSRAEIDALELFPETIDVRALLSDVFQSMADDRGVTGEVEWRLDLPERLPYLQADPVRLRQILFNLLSNAAKWTQQGMITLGAIVEPPHLRISVADTGCGISIEQQQHIFEPFVTGAARGRRPDGIGLGLSITRRLVALHHGTLTLESRPAAGSIFHVYLPLPDLSGQPARLPETARPTLLLLVAQHEPASEITALAQRRRAPLRRVRTQSDVDALLVDTQPVGIIWDLDQATSDDWTIIQHIRSHPQLRCIPLLLYGQQQGETPDLTMGVTEFLIKPLTESTLVKHAHALRHAVGPLLIVDDDPPARECYETMLAKAFPGHTILLAENGAVALELLAHERPGLVILDLLMPEVDGFALLEALRADPATRQTPVLVLSGRMLSLEDVQRLNHAHVTFQSKKMLTSQEMLDQITRVISGDDALAQPTSALVKQAIAYIHQHYGRQLSRQEIAGFVGVSERYLTDIFHQELGLSPWEYLNRFRVMHAQRLLRETRAGISGIAAQVGFDDPSYFGRVFRKFAGQTPRAYREQPGDSIETAPVLMRDEG